MKLADDRHMEIFQTINNYEVIDELDKPRRSDIVI
jgi:hypothetical protein